jgi:hypothetical protein
VPGCLCRRWKVWRELRPTQKQEEELATKEEESTDGQLTPHTYLPFDKGALVIYRLGFWLAPSWWLIDTRKRYLMADRRDPGIRSRTTKLEERDTALYVMVWFLLLAAAWLVSPNNESIATALGGVALFRLLEIAIAVLGFVLDQREPKIARSLITIAVLALQVALIFAILDHSFARNDFLKPAELTVDQTGIHGAEKPFEYLYLSWTYMTTLGNQYIPKSELARILQLGANTSGILLLGIVAARAIGLVGATKKIAVDLEGRVSVLETKTEHLSTQISNDPS